MEFNDKTIITRFIVRTGMFITTQDKENIVSFITGYEIGSATCDFTMLLETYMLEAYEIPISNDRWIGQLTRLSELLSLTWVRTFKKLSLQLILGGNTVALPNELSEILQTRIIGLIDRIAQTGDPWFNESWVESWLSLCLIKCKWFREIWTENELSIIEAIDDIVMNKRVFSDNEHRIPSTELLHLKEKFDERTTKRTSN
jgi:hypothetical protein